MTLITSILFISLIDYVLYNVLGAKYSNQNVNPYRVFFVILQIIFSTAIWYYAGIADAILFVVSWWFGIWDMIYYLFDILIYKIFGKSFENGAYLKWGLYKQMSWLNFTFFHTVLRYKITKSIFIGQMVLGVQIITAIKLYF